MACPSRSSPVVEMYPSFLSSSLVPYCVSIHLFALFLLSFFCLFPFSLLFLLYPPKILISTTRPRQILFIISVSIWGVCNQAISRLYADVVADRHALNMCMRLGRRSASQPAKYIPPERHSLQAAHAASNAVRWGCALASPG